MISPLQVGVTGGIGSGKSLVCKIFQALGAPVYNADQRGKWLTDNDPEIIHEVTVLFGAKAYKDNHLDRPYIANIVFNNPEKLNQLNHIIHPKVGRDYSTWLKEQTYVYVIKEAAIMFESGSHKMLDKIINVYASEEMRIKRVMQRDKFRTEKEIKAIIEKQMPEPERHDRSDYIVNNDESEMLLPQLLDLHSAFMVEKVC
ncbi:dephospho-CoA kinase [Fulvivirga sediminis]|uniref:Dephospho-CoA kinase n=1 Tax=Fulvivirga sediminis TaxID=2803949 RepID=A0A937F4K1_9BACT|nr:dephospho-CoA kinase [Fulvivirga sediminis]MBL3654584.1 dephospho-CoA kinase [Fulvivirga sediminis]